jgi:hypothetical protein
MNMLCKQVLQSIALSMKAKKTAQGVSKRKSKEILKAILAKNIEWLMHIE